MNSPAIAETVALIQSVGATLLDVSTTTDVERAADLRRAVGDLVGRAEHHLRSKSMGTALQSAFTAALAAEAGFVGFERVRSIALAVSPASKTASAARVACIQFALIGMSQALTATTFRSREDAKAASARVNDAFGPAIDAAADAGEQQAYRDLVGLHAAVTRDLNQRARPLPQIVPYRFARSMPTLTLSQRLYGEGGRADELKDENKVIHPLFAGAEGRALSI
jgi:prophage DNA circulation protein